MGMSVVDTLVAGDFVVALVVVELTASVDLLRLDGASTTTGFGPDADPNGAPYSAEGEDCLFFLLAL